MNKLILCAVGLCVTIHVVRGFPQGAPVQQESCYNLQPIHRDQRTQQLVANQTAQAPYKIFVSRQEYVPCTDQRQCPQGVIQVLLQGQPNQIFPGAAGQQAPFRGFIIQAKSQSGSIRSFGQFFPMQTGDSKVIQCPNGFTLTHALNNDKQQVRFNWVPEPNMREPIRFTATVVQNYANIYPSVLSDFVKPRALTVRTASVTGINPPAKVTTTTPTPITTKRTTTTTIATTTTSLTTTSTTTMPPTTTSTTPSVAGTSTTTSLPQSGSTEGLGGGASGLSSGIGMLATTLMALLLF